MMVFLNLSGNIWISCSVNVIQKHFKNVSQNLEVENRVWKNMSIAYLQVLQVQTCLSLAFIKVNKDQSFLFLYISEIYFIHGI